MCKTNPDGGVWEGKKVNNMAYTVTQREAGSVWYIAGGHTKVEYRKPLTPGYSEVLILQPGLQSRFKAGQIVRINNRNLYPRCCRGRS